MKNSQLVNILFVLFTLVMMLTPDHSFAKGRGGGSSGSGPVAVRGYYRSNGTYVAPHFRSSPGSSSGSTSDYVHKDSSGWSSIYQQSSQDNGTYQSGYPKVERSQSARMTFLRSCGYRKLPPGYEIDHILPLSQGGKDIPNNMQLLTEDEHHLKTARERHKD